MPKFLVTVAQTTYYQHNFEAEDGEEAKQAALEEYQTHGSEAFDSEYVDDAFIWEVQVAPKPVGSETTQWSQWFDNPFHAIKAAADANGTPEDFDKAIVSMTEPAAAWYQNFDGANMLDDILQEIAGATNIVVQSDEGKPNLKYRAAYLSGDDDDDENGADREYCTACNTRLEEFRIGKCDGCLELSTQSPEEDEDTCSECGEDNTGGEGYDGLCGNCADRQFGEAESDA